MRRSRVHLKKLFHRSHRSIFKKSVTVTSEDAVHENCSHVARTGTAGMGTSCTRGIHPSRKKDHLARTRGQGDEVRDDRQSERMRRPESKEQDRVESRVEGAQHSVVGTRDEATADKEDQRGTSRARTTTTGNPRLRTTPREDVQVGVCPRQTGLRVGGVDSRGGRFYSVSTAEEVRVARGTVTGNVSEGDELTTTNAAHSNNEAGPRGRNGRPGETSGTSASHSWTAEDDAEVQRNLKTMSEQQRAMLRKSGKQLSVDEIDQLTTCQARHAHTDLPEIGNVGQSKALVHV